MQAWSVSFPALQAAPPHSFINVEDFKSIEDFNDFIENLKSDEGKYRSYFWWRKHYRVVDTHEAQFQAFCDLCQYAHNQRDSNEVTKDYKLYSSFKHYWNHAGICREPSALAIS